MPLTGYSSTTKGNLLLDGGQLRIGNVILGTMRGGARFEPGEEWNETEFDSRAAPVEGLDRLGFSRAVITGTLLEASSANLLLIMPGATTATAGGVETITPRSARTFIAAQDNARVILDRGDGKFLEVRFPKFLAKMGSIETADRTEAGIPITLEARAVGTDGTTIMAPTWVVKIHDAVGTLTI